jgi:hypothetical protein
MCSRSYLVSTEKKRRKNRLTISKLSQNDDLHVLVQVSFCTSKSKNDMGKMELAYFSARQNPHPLRSEAAAQDPRIYCQSERLKADVRNRTLQTQADCFGKRFVHFTTRAAKECSATLKFQRLSLWAAICTVELDRYTTYFTLSQSIDASITMHTTVCLAR